MPLSVRLDETTEQELRKAASVLDRPLGWLVKEAIHYYLDEIADLEIALQRLRDPRAQWVDHEDARRELGVED